MTPRLALMSLQPRHARNVLAGQKTVELRRRSVRLRPGDTVFVYASSPEMEVRGRFVVGRVIREPLDRLWEAVRTRAKVTREEFDTYFRGLRQGVAIEIEDARPIDPVSLAGLRRQWPGFQPPQVFRYINEVPRGWASGDV